MNEPKHQAAFRERRLCARWVCSNICLGCQALIFCPSSRDLTMWDLTWKRNKISSWAISSLPVFSFFKVNSANQNHPKNITSTYVKTEYFFGIVITNSSRIWCSSASVHQCASVRRTCHKLWLFGANIISPWHHDIFDLRNNAWIWYTLRLGFHQQLSSASAASSVENRRGESRYINTSLLRSSRGDIFISRGESRYINYQHLPPVSQVLNPKTGGNSLVAG